MPSSVKYQKIAAELKKRIANGTYAERLPARRCLMQEFSVSSRTMHKVFADLKNTNCIIPTSHGTIINNDALQIMQQPVRIVLAAPDILNTQHSDALHQQLISEIAAAGFELIICDIRHKNVSQIVREHQLNSNDAVIFTYSSFQPETAVLLNEQRIPFVSSNRPPEGVEINWVDWDHIELFNDFVGNMLMRGARSLDIFWTSPKEEMQDNHAAIMHDFRAVKRSYSLFNRTLDAFPENFWGNAEKYADHLCSLKKLPDAVWVLDNSRSKLAQLLAERGITDSGFLVTHNCSRIKDNSVAFYSEQGYRKLAHKVWQLLCYVRRHPQANPRGLKQRCEVKFYEYKYKQLADRMQKSV